MPGIGARGGKTQRESSGDISPQRMQTSKPMAALNGWPALGVEEASKLQSPGGGHGGCNSAGLACDRS